MIRDISDPDLDKIISTVDKKLKLNVSKREELRLEIERAARWYHDYSILRHKGRARKLAKRLTAFTKAAKTLRTQVADETFFNSLVGTLIIHGFNRGAADTVKYAIEYLIKAADLFWAPPGAALSTGRREGSEKEWLAGVRLPEIYERVFEKKAGRSRANGQPSGPCVRFINAAMDVLKIQYKPESIAKAITRQRARMRKK
jgi:hypothetical protein